MERKGLWDTLMQSCDYQENHYILTAIGNQDVMIVLCAGYKTYGFGDQSSSINSMGPQRIAFSPI